MTNTTYTLQFVPSGWTVVPEEPTEDMQIAALSANDWVLGSIRDDYVTMIKTAPPLNTPPVLRWEGVQYGLSHLLVGNKVIAIVVQHDNGRWDDSVTLQMYHTKQEARRAAEKALGFPDGLIIEEV